MRRLFAILLITLNMFSIVSCAQQAEVLLPTPIPTPKVEIIEERVTITGAAGSLQQLTIKGPEEYPYALSPDMQWLLLNVTDSQGSKVVYKLNLQNQTKVVLTSKNSKSTGGAWLPDMSGILFSSDRSGNSVIVQSLGISGEVGARFITPSSLGNALFPSISPDGKDIAFSIFNSIYDNQIAIIDVSGTNLRVFGQGWLPQFSPDGKTLNFTQKTGDYTHIYTMSASNGSNLTQLTSGSSINLAPTWSPNGKKIAFASDRSGKYRHLFVMDDTGQNITQLTEGNYNVGYTTWGKDGYIYFSANAGNNWDVWRVKLK